MADIKEIEDKLTVLKHKYINALPDKMTDILTEWADCTDKKAITSPALASFLHKLAGSAGLYDLFILGERARSVELLILEVDGTLSNEMIFEIDTRLTQLKEMVTELCQ
ncbi:MAG: Hpt domain-containing protein [Gammaproteobacteria bacterium]|nr:Hpt domain-containing protein [Gammaproteobacteria bacterium]